MFIDLKEILKDNRVVNGEIIYEAGSVVSELTLKDFLFRKGDDGYTYEPCPNGVYLFFKKEEGKEKKEVDSLNQAEKDLKAAQERINKFKNNDKLLEAKKKLIDSAIPQWS
jgi:hypothetical protein